MSDPINEQLVMISGESGTGKSASLMNIRNQERWLYLNCEAGKRLPFRNKFQSHVITDPYQIDEAFQETAEGGSMHADVDGIIIDTATFLMDMFESLYIRNSANSQAAWGDYADFWRTLMQQHVASSDKAVIILAHTRLEYDEKSLSNRVAVPIKGSLKNNGLEAYFSTVVSTKKIELKDLEGQDKTLLNITPQEEALGFKHVFQVQLTRATTGDRIRSPLGMFGPDQVYIDNDAQKLLDFMGEYYC